MDEGIWEGKCIITARRKDVSLKATDITSYQPNKISSNRFMSSSASTQVGSKNDICEESLEVGTIWSKRIEILSNG